MSMDSDNSPAWLGARTALRSMARAAIIQSCCRLHIQADGKVIEESRSGFDPVLYPDAHHSFDNSRVLAICDLTFADLVNVVALGSGLASGEMPSSYITWESTLGALGDTSDLADHSVNWFYRPASRTAPAALIAGIAGRPVAETSEPARAIPQAA